MSYPKAKSKLLPDETSVRIKELEKVVGALCRFVTYISTSANWPIGEETTGVVREYGKNH